MEKGRFEIIRGPEKKEQLPGNVVLVKLPDGRVRIVYGVHMQEQNPEDIGSADALALETGIAGSYDNQASAEELMRKLAEHKQYKKIVEAIQKTNTPIYFFDLNDQEVEDALSKFLITVEMATGFALLASLAKDVVKQKRQMTRREFLKKFGQTAAGLYLSTQTLEILSQSFEGIERKKIDNDSKSTIVRNFLVDLNEKIHPETTAVVVTLRNNLAAQKLMTIINRLKSSGISDPEIASVMGGGHIGLEVALEKDDAERRRLIDLLLHHPMLPKESREKIATITRMGFDTRQNRWVAAEIFKDPVLAPLEKK